MNGIYEIRLGVFAPELKNQLKDLKIAEEKLNEWQNIHNFICRCHIMEVITDKQQEKLFKQQRV